MAKVQVLLVAVVVFVPGSQLGETLALAEKHTASKSELDGHDLFQQCHKCSYAAEYPKQYVAYKTSTLRPESLDGDLSKQAWTEVAWTDEFVDISTMTIPKFRTRAKMRWDDDFLYVAAELQEPEIWATLQKHDSVIFQDNDFEVFVDAGATTHYYKEFEVNAWNTTWDLCLNKPYSDGGYENSSRVFSPNGWDMQPPLRSAVAVSPSTAINNFSAPGDHWSVEIALPLRELAFNSTLNMPVHGTFWRIDFSRVEWNIDVDHATNTFTKAPSCQSCPTPGSPSEDNWVWSPKGAVNMHLPERWGILQFSSEAVNKTMTSFYAEWPSRSAAMAIYYANHAYFKKHGSFTSNMIELLPYSATPFEICDCAKTEIRLGDGGATFNATVVVPADASPTYAATVRDDRFLTVEIVSATGSAMMG